MSRPSLREDHGFLAWDDLSDCAPNIQRYLGLVAGGSTFTADVVGTVPLTVNGASTLQTGDLIDVNQNVGGAALFQLKTVASAVNGVTATAAATGNAPIISAIGTDANVGLTIRPKGTGTVVINGGGTTPGAGLTVVGVNSAVNGVTVTNAATTNPPIVSATGTDANIALNLASKGTSAVNLQQGAATTLIVTGSGIVVNQLTITASATTVAPSIAATGTDANIGVNIASKGTGAVTLQQGAASTLIVTGSGTVVNQLTITASATTVAPILSATGTDANIGIALNTKGTGAVVVNNATAIPAGGSAAASITIGSTAAFGLYVGSGAPTFSAAQGSIYLRSDGSSTSTRAYIATNSAGAWTNVTTAA